jgi:hypothetical protein
MFISPIYVLCSCPIAVLQYSIFCTPVFAVEDMQLACWFLETAHSICVSSHLTPHKKRHFLSTTKTNLSFLFRAVGTAYCNKMNMQDEFLNCAFPKVCQLATYLMVTVRLHWELRYFAKLILWDATLGQQVCGSDVRWKISSQLLKIKT